MAEICKGSEGPLSIAKRHRKLPDGSVAFYVGPHRRDVLVTTDGPYAADHLRSKLIGRVVGVLSIRPVR